MSRTEPRPSDPGQRTLIEWALTNDQAHWPRAFAAYELARAAPSMLIELEILSSITATYMLSRAPQRAIRLR